MTFSPLSSDDMVVFGLEVKNVFTPIITIAITKIKAPIIVPHINVGPWANKTVPATESLWRPNLVISFLTFSSLTCSGANLAIKLLRVSLNKFFIFSTIDNKISLLESYIHKQNLYQQKLNFNSLLDTNIFLDWINYLY